MILSKQSKKLVGALHAIIIIFVYVSPLFIPWQFLILLIILYFLQKPLFGGCVLNRIQFGKNSEGFTPLLLKKLGFNFEYKKVRFVLDYIVPTFLIITAIIYQEFIN